MIRCDQKWSIPEDFLIVSGALNVEIDNKKVGKMETGEIFGELSLILGEERKASVKAILPTEIIEINVQ